MSNDFDALRAKVNKCKFCDWTGKNSAMGPHFLSAHVKDITNRIAAVVTPEGVTVEDIVKATGYSKESVRNRLRALDKDGRVVVVGQAQLLAFTPDSKVEFKILRSGTAQCSTCEKIFLKTRFPWRNSDKGLRRIQCKTCYSSRKNTTASSAKLIRQEVLELKSVVPAVEVDKTQTVPADTLVDRLTERIYRQADEALKAKYRDEYEALVSAKMEQMLTNLMKV